MAKGKKTSLAVRAGALVFALVLAALAARLWIGAAPRETSATRAASDASAPIDAVPDAVTSAPPLHGEHSAEDEEAMREILRGTEREMP